MNENNNENEERKDESLLLRFKKFVKRNSIRLKAGAAATIVAGSIGFAALNLNKDDDVEIPEPTNSLEQVDPTYNPEEDDNQNIIIPGPSPSETITPNDGEEENNQQEENTTCETEDENTIPSQSPTGGEETPTHVHKFTEWTPYSDLTETRECECGVTQLRTHKFDITKAYEAGEDDTHTVIKTEECTSCGFEQTIRTQENCNYTINNFDDEFEYKTCKDCGKEVKHEHKLDEGTLNEDGTMTYTCLNKGCEYVKVKEKEITPPITEEHVHNYSNPVISYLDLNEKEHVKVSTSTCTEEGCTNPVLEIKSDPTSHIYKTGVNGIDKETGKPITTYTCKDCGHEKVVERTHQGTTDPIEHTHNFNGEAEISYEQTENGHVKVYTYTCIDPNCPKVNEKKIVKSDEIKHEFDKTSGVISEDGKSITYSCECGETITEEYTKPPIEHTHTYGNAETSYENITDAKHTKVLTKTCTECGEKEISKTTTNHNFVKVEDTIQNGVEGTLYSCECGKEKFVEKTINPPEPVHSHTFGEEVFAGFENITDTHHTKVYVKTCTDSNCTTQGGAKEESKVTSTHSFSKTDRTETQDGTTYEVWACECGKEKLVEKSQIVTPPVVEHKYVETGEERYVYDENGHQKVKVLKCSVEGCTDHQEKTEPIGEKETHNFDKTNGTISDDKTTITYKCSCGATLEETYTPPTVEHKYVETGEERTIYDENGHQKVKVLKCSVEGCTEHQEKTEPIGEKEEHSYTTTEVTDPETGITTITSTCSCGHTKTETKNPEVKDPEKIDIASLISIDKTTFTYNGTDQHPTISGLPEGVTANYESTPGVNAGEYTWHITFTTPEGFTADPIDINYTIEPANVTLNYEYKDGKVEATYSNILPEDILNTNYKINGEDVGTGATLDKAGLQTIESTIEIDPEKLGNYNLSETLNQSATYNVKNQNNWFELNTDYNVNEDGTITVNISLSTDKIPYYEEYGITSALSFNIYFDTEKLEYNDEFINGDEWMGEANPDNFNNPVIDGENYGVSTVAWYETRDEVQGVNVCSLTFTPKNQDDKDIIIKIDDIFYGNYTGIEDEWGDDILPFAFTNGPSYCIINPTNPIEKITIDNNLLDDIIYSYEDNYDDEDKAKSLEILKDCMENGYKIPEKYIPNEDEYEDEEDYTEEDVEDETGDEDLEEETLEEDNLESAETGEEETTTEETKDEDTDAETDQTDAGETDTEEDTETQEIEEDQSYEFEIEAIEESEDNQTNEDDSPKTYQKTL